MILVAGLVFSQFTLAEEPATEQASPYTQLCIAALESKEAMNAKARELNIGRREMKQVVCNDLSLYEFVEAHQDNMQEWSIATVE